MCPRNMRFLPVFTLVVAAMLVAGASAFTFGTATTGTTASTDSSHTTGSSFSSFPVVPNTAPAPFTVSVMAAFAALVVAFF